MNSVTDPHSSTHAAPPPAAASAQPLILIVEDERKLAELLADYMHAAGYATHIVGDGRDVDAALAAHAPALMLLDLMLPGKDGIAVCRDVRATCDVPIVMVTARVEEIDRLLGLELGADDYICKPFSPREVVARVRAILRRTRAVQEPVREARLVIDDERHRVTLDGHEVALTPVEFRLLRLLASHPGRVYSRARLLEDLYADHRVVTDRTVDSHVKNLRKKLEAVSPAEALVHSVYGLGYKIEL
ncbi:MAG: winged helix-turn-helix domain-containing protein [Proteobacteria bacterium]|nr:winged helix-turn-helix domain-containing protein [Pseudomonadota bacterium]